MDSPSSSVRLLTYNNARRTIIEHLEDLHDSIWKEGDIALQRASLPLSFPKKHFSIMISISWMESGALVEDTMEFSNTDIGRVRSWTHPVKWQVVSTEQFPGEIFGSVEMDPRVFYDILPLFDISAPFILRRLITSISRQETHRIISSVASAPGITPGTSPWNLEVVQIRTGSHSRIEELGRRYITKRPCSIRACTVSLPGTGPPFCIQHVHLAKDISRY